MAEIYVSKLLHSGLLRNLWTSEATNQLWQPMRYAENLRRAIFNTGQDLCLDHDLVVIGGDNE